MLLSRRAAALRRARDEERASSGTGSARPGRRSTTVSSNLREDARQAGVGRGRAVLVVMWNQWNDVFRETLGHAERSLVSELRDVRNNWAHQKPFSSDDAYRALDSAARLLTAVSAPQADEIEKMKMELLRVRFDEQVRSEKRKTRRHRHRERRRPAASSPGARSSTPHQDVASGRYQQAEFAADLWQVHLGEGSDEYRKPGRVLPPHLPDREPEAAAGRRRPAARRARAATRSCSCRPTSAAARPTRCWRSTTCSPARRPASCRASTRCCRRRGASKLADASSASCWSATRSRPATRSPSPTARWSARCGASWPGSSAARRRFERVAADDEKATSPGDVLRELFNEYGPCLILIDEWVAYARQLHDQSDLPAGSFETQFTFAQALTESAKLAKNCLLVISLPASDTDGLAAHAGRRRRGRRRARARGARPAAQRRRPRRVLLAAGQRRGGLRDRPPPAVRAADRPATSSSPATPSPAPSPTSTAPSSRSSRPSAATPTTRSGSRPPTRSTPRSSTGSTPTGPRW